MIKQSRDKQYEFDFLNDAQHDAWMKNEMDKVHAAMCVIGSMIAAGAIIMGVIMWK